MADALAEARALFDEGARRWAPPPRLTVAEWAERHRKLPEASAAKGAPWRNDVAPYLVEIMNVCRCARDERNAGVRAVALAKAAQTGGSSALENIIGFHIEHDSCPILVVHPTDEAVEEWSKDRFDDLVRSTPALAARVRDRRAPKGAHQSGSTIKHKVFPGGQLFAGSAKSPNTFARRAARLVIADDFDRFPATVGEEGDPGRLLSARMASFHDGLPVYVSTPTLKGGRIDTLYSRSDQRRYVVACPHCGREDWISWSDPNHLRVVYDGEDAGTGRLECPSSERGGCGGRMGEADRRRMVAAGRWVATADPLEPGLVGFHLPAMISTLGGVTLAGLVGKWLSAKAEGREALRVFINTYLGEAWEDRSAKLEPHTLMARREAYGDEGVQVPQAAVCLTAGVDVQLDRFELQVIGWGPGDEKWVLDYRAIPGDPRRAETRTALLEALSTRYRHASGHLLAVMAVCIDSGYATDEVYELVFANQRRYVPGQPATTQVLYATKGFAGRSGEPIVGKPTDRGAAGRRRPVRLFPVNVDDAKTAILVTSLPKQIRTDEPNPGALHFPLSVDEEYFAQLCAEHREAKYNQAGVATHFAWIQDRERNEALDTAVLALAAFRLLNPNLISMTAALAAIPPPVPGGPPGGAPPAAPPPPRPAGRQISRSGYLGR